MTITKRQNAEVLWSSHTIAYALRVQLLESVCKCEKKYYTRIYMRIRSHTIMPYAVVWLHFSIDKVSTAPSLLNVSTFKRFKWKMSFQIIVWFATTQLIANRLSQGAFRPWFLDTHVWIQYRYRNCNVIN